MAKRLMLGRVLLLDESCGESNVREIEMIVDGIVDFEPMYAAQFFADTRLYGFGEAYLYLRNFVESKKQLSLARQERLSSLRGKIEGLASRVNS